MEVTSGLSGLWCPLQTLPRAQSSFQLWTAPSGARSFETTSTSNYVLDHIAVSPPDLCLHLALPALSLLFSM